MLDFMKKILGAQSTDMSEVMARGGVIIDVRSKGEYASGHVRGSINIPLDTLSSQLAKLDKSKPVITCCASGMRSSSAKGMLQKSGFAEVHNGGAWQNLLKLEK